MGAGFGAKIGGDCEVTMMERGNETCFTFSFHRGTWSSSSINDSCRCNLHRYSVAFRQYSVAI